jgi:hypothetical protein
MRVAPGDVLSSGICQFSSMMGVVGEMIDGLAAAVKVSFWPAVTFSSGAAAWKP